MVPPLLTPLARLLEPGPDCKMSQVHAARGIPSQSRWISWSKRWMRRFRELGGGGGRRPIRPWRATAPDAGPDEYAVVAKGHPHSGLGDRVALGVGDALDEAVQAQPAKWSSSRARRDEELSAMIRRIHNDSDGTYRIPRVYAELVEGGCRVGRKRVARLMRESGLVGVSRRRGIRTMRVDRNHRAAPDRVERPPKLSCPRSRPSWTHCGPTSES